jgi:hypothetical protein
MSLTSLRGAAGFASSAFDTARSTWKAMAEAAVNPADTAETEPAVEAAERTATPAPKKGSRRGTLLDAYA